MCVHPGELRSCTFWALRSLSPTCACRLYLLSTSQGVYVSATKDTSRLWILKTPGPYRQHYFMPRHFLRNVLVDNNFVDHRSKKQTWQCAAEEEPTVPFDWTWLIHNNREIHVKPPRLTAENSKAAKLVIKTNKLRNMHNLVWSLDATWP